MSTIKDEIDGIILRIDDALSEDKYYQEEGKVKNFRDQNSENKERGFFQDTHQIRHGTDLQPDSSMQRERVEGQLSLSLEASRIALYMLSNTLGECRMAQPFAPLRPVINESGELEWCCTHSPPHCR